MPFSEFVWTALSVVSCACVGVQFFLIRAINQRFNRQTRMMRQLLSGTDHENLETLLERNFEETHIALQNSARALESVQQLQSDLSGFVQNFALVRYDAFDDVTGQMSFSLALLDGNGNGSIVTSIFGRNTSRCFGKTVVAGAAQQTLSEEEQSALCEALKRTSGEDWSRKNAAILQNGNGHLNGAELLAK